MDATMEVLYEPAWPIWSAFLPFQEVHLSKRNDRCLRALVRSPIVHL